MKKRAPTIWSMLQKKEIKKGTMERKVYYKRKREETEEIIFLSVSLMYHKNQKKSTVNMYFFHEVLYMLVFHSLGQAKNQIEKTIKYTISEKERNILKELLIGLNNIDGTREQNKIIKTSNGNYRVSINLFLKTIIEKPRDLN